MRDRDAYVVLDLGPEPFTLRHLEEHAHPFRAWMKILFGPAFYPPPLRRETSPSPGLSSRGSPAIHSHCADPGYLLRYVGTNVATSGGRERRLLSSNERTSSRGAAMAAPARNKHVNTQSE